MSCSDLAGLPRRLGTPDCADYSLDHLWPYSARQVMAHSGHHLKLRAGDGRRGRSAARGLHDPVPITVHDKRRELQAAEPVGTVTLHQYRCQLTSSAAVIVGTVRRTRHDRADI